MNSTWLITSELASQCTRKVLFTCVVYTNINYYSNCVVCCSFQKVVEAGGGVGEGGRETEFPTFLAVNLNLNSYCLTVNTLDSG